MPVLSNLLESNILTIRTGYNRLEANRWLDERTVKCGANREARAYYYRLISSTLTSLTLVPVAPVMIRPSTIWRAW